ncbi:hypothetical protein ACFLSZ_04120 [Candidatus Bipolaricaulota bacterium]
MGSKKRLCGALVSALLTLVALTQAQISALAQPELGGSFQANLGSSESSFVSLDSLVAILSLSDEGWKLSSRVQFADGEFTQLDVIDDRTFGPFRLRSTCVFTPDSGFSRLSSTARFEALDTQFANYIYLSDDATSSYDQLTARWQIGSVSLSGVARFGICPAEFRTAQLTGKWYVQSCNLFMDVRSAFTGEEGLDYLRITSRFPDFPLLSNDWISTELRITFLFELDRKEVSPSFRMTVGSINTCLTPYLSFVTGASNSSLTEVRVYGWELECEIGEAVDVFMATSLDPDRNREITGNEDYWEVWILSGSSPSCCDRELLWEVATYFGDTPGVLFNREVTTFKIEIPLGRQVTTSLGAGFAESAPHWTMNFGFKVRF